MALSAATVAKAPAEAAPEAPPKKKSKLLLIIIVAVVLLAGAGAGAWFFMLQGDAEEVEAQAQSKPPVFLTIDQFTVNLQPEDGQQFLQVAMTLKVADPAIADAVKLRMPEVRSRVLLLLSSKKPSQLSSHEGKVKLADEIAREVEASLPREMAKNKKKTKTGSAEEEAKAKKARKATAKDDKAETAALQRVQAVYFTHFIVQ